MTTGKKIQIGVLLLAGTAFLILLVGPALSLIIFPNKHIRLNLSQIDPSAKSHVNLVVSYHHEITDKSKNPIELTVGGSTYRLSSKDGLFIVFNKTKQFEIDSMRIDTDNRAHYELIFLKGDYYGRSNQYHDPR